MSSNYSDFGSGLSLYSGEGIEGIMAVMGILVIISVLFVLAACVILIISWWKIFKKAGKPEWAAIVPVYNNVIMLDIAGMAWWHIFVIFGFSFLSGFASAFEENAVAAFISLLCSAGSFVYQVIIYTKIAGKFGKDSGFKVLIALLPIVGVPMLAFGKSTYEGSQYNYASNMSETTDDISNGLLNNSNTENAGFCPNCGSKVTSGSMFCQNCGSSLQK